MREIVSCSGTNTEGLGKLVDHELRPVNEAARSFIQDTPDLLRRIQAINERGPQPPGTIPISRDVVALYPSVPTDRGLVRLREALTNSGMGRNKVDWLCRCIEVI